MLVSTVWPRMSSSPMDRIIAFMGEIVRDGRN